jgi:hypothetical protein
LGGENGGVEVVEEEGIAELEEDVHGGEWCISRWVYSR